MTYSFCTYHEIECDYDGQCTECPHNTEEDRKWFKQDEATEESEADFPQAEDIEPTVESFKRTMDNIEKFLP